MGKKELHNCQQCGKEFEAPKWRKRKYCTHECSVIHKRNDYPEIKCKQCDKELSRQQKSRFNYSKKNGLADLPFCSRVCFGTYYNTQEKRYCAYCGTSFEAHHSSPKKYCCKQHAAMGKASKKYNVCAYFRCDKVFRVRESQEEKYCCRKHCHLDKRSDDVKSIPEDKPVKGNYHTYLTNTYIKNIIKQAVPTISDKDIPDPLIETKRNHIKVQRELKRLKKQINQ